MKTKGIPIYEQHVEKLVLAIAVIICVGLTVLQFIGEPNAVKMGGRDVAPGDVDDLLAQKADGLRGRLAPDAPAGVELNDPLTALEYFSARLGNTVDPDVRLAQVHLGFSPEVVGIGPSRGDTEYLVPDIAAPFQVAVETHWNALDPAVLANTDPALDPLRARYTEPPFDIVWNTVAARFDLESFRNEILKEDPSGEKLSVPPGWYNDHIYFMLDVAVEREQLVDGQWVGGEIIDPLPGRFSARARLTETADASIREEIFTNLSDQYLQEQIIQPGFYALASGSLSPPTYDVLSGDDDEPEEVAQLRRLLAKNEAARARHWDHLVALGGPLEEKREDPPDRPSRPGGGRGGGGGTAPPPGGGFGLGSGGGGGVGTVGDEDDGSGEPNKKERIRVTKRVASLDRKIDRYREQLVALVGDEFDVQGADDSGVDLGQDRELIVWAHDIDVLPGQTYRYRVRLDLYNPFFVQRLNLMESQHSLADSVRMSSATSEWSQSSEVGPPLQIFLSSANPAEGSRGAATLLPGLPPVGSVTAEIFRFTDGRWWTDRFTAAPGDQLGAARKRRDAEGDNVDIDFGTDWFLLDIVADVSTGRSKVLLQNARTGEVSTLRDPVMEQLDPEVQMLRDAVKDAET